MVPRLSKRRQRTPPSALAAALTLTAALTASSAPRLALAVRSLSRQELEELGPMKTAASLPLVFAALTSDPLAAASASSSAATFIAPRPGRSPRFAELSLKMSQASPRGESQPLFYKQDGQVDMEPGFDKKIFFKKSGVDEEAKDEEPESNGLPPWPQEWLDEVEDIRLIHESPLTKLYKAKLKEPLEGFPSGAEVVVKDIELRSSSHLEKVEREFEIAKRFSGGRFVGFLKADYPFRFLHGSRAMLMMEAADGTMEEKVLRHSFQSVPWHTRVRLLIELFEGIQEMHDQRIVHRDLKPPNLFILGDCEGESPSCHVKIGDFGISVGLFGTGDPFEKGVWEQEGPMGSPAYMPPECRKGRPVDSATQDFFAAGVILFEVLFGENPRTTPDWHKREDLFEHVAGKLGVSLEEKGLLQRAGALGRRLMADAPLERLGISEALQELQEMERELREGEMSPPLPWP